MTHPHGASTGSSPLARGLRSWRPFLVFLSGIIPARAGFTDPLPRAARRPSGHPRSRGVYPRGRTAASSSSGSSPLARGLRGRGVPDRLQAGIIPARAGFTSAQRQSSQHGKDHPRSRGVYTGTVVAEGDGSGSSPLARGLRLHVQNLGEDARIIPARAGFTSRTATRKPSERIIPARAGFTWRAGCGARGGGDHPRSRGVYVEIAMSVEVNAGSSPLARGLPATIAAAWAADRIIPARAGFTSSPLAAATTGEDHPRSRGVYPTARTSTAARRGSSPLARGLRGEPDRDVGGVGIIPARAGFTRLIVWDGCIFWGSSPLARGLPPPPERPPAGRRIIPARAGFTGRDGTGPATAADHPRSRGVYHSLSENGSAHSWIIPARAGFTNQNPRPHRRRADHPRSRGVYTTTGSSTGPRPGSSPLARGLRGDRVLRGALLGIIPARAGFTWAAAQPGPGSRDHPRSRGVYWDSEYVEGQVGGSSPLARGLLAALRAEGYIIRIIPARAGFTGRLPQRDGRLGDHPRSRGVYGRCPPGVIADPGSSPLARGLRRAAREGREQGGIIPARAGFTQGEHSAHDQVPDHPRSRGVYTTPPPICRSTWGSSPLARGLPAPWTRPSSCSRIIPARAGFTHWE